MNPTPKFLLVEPKTKAIAPNIALIDEMGKMGIASRA